MASLIGQTVSRCRILERLGADGMGVVHKAQNLKLTPAVALTLLPPDLTCDPDSHLVLPSWRHCPGLFVTVDSAHQFCQFAEWRVVR